MWKPRRPKFSEAARCLAACLATLPHPNGAARSRAATQWQHPRVSACCAPWVAPSRLQTRTLLRRNLRLIQRSDPKRVWFDTSARRIPGCTIGREKHSVSCPTIGRYTKSLRCFAWCSGGPRSRSSRGSIIPSRQYRSPGFRRRRSAPTVGSCSKSWRLQGWTRRAKTRSIAATSSGSRWTFGPWC